MFNHPSLLSEAMVERRAPTYSNTCQHYLPKALGSHGETVIVHDSTLISTKSIALIEIAICDYDVGLDFTCQCQVLSVPLSPSQSLIFMSISVYL